MLKTDQGVSNVIITKDQFTPGIALAEVVDRIYFPIHDLLSDPPLQEVKTTFINGCFAHNFHPMSQG